MIGDRAEDDEFGEVVRRIRRDAWQRNRGRATELATMVAAPPQDGNGLTDDARDRALALAHQLRGSAGTFGYPEAAATAEQIQRLLHGHETLTHADRDRLVQLAGDLCAALEHDPGDDG